MWLGFVDSLARLGASIRVGTLGLSPEGRSLPYVIAARPMVDNPADAELSGKPIIYVQGNIHSGEVEGKEAAQMILRDLTLGPLARLLDSIILVMVPIYNADGNERFGPGAQNRPGQNGPAIGRSQHQRSGSQPQPRLCQAGSARDPRRVHAPQRMGA